MPFEIIEPGKSEKQLYDDIVGDETVRQYQCENCGAVIAGTNMDVYQAMLLWGKQLSWQDAMRRFEKDKLQFVCPECGEQSEFTRIDPEDEKPANPDKSDKPTHHDGAQG